MKQIKTMRAQTHLWVCWSNRILIFCNSECFQLLQHSNTWLLEGQRVYLFTDHTEHMHYVIISVSTTK